MSEKLFNNFNSESQDMCLIRFCVCGNGNIFCMRTWVLVLAVKFCPDRFLATRRNRFFWRIGYSAATTGSCFRNNQGAITGIPEPE